MAKAAVADREYETLFIVSIDATQKKIDEFIDKVKGILNKEKATFKSTQVWGRRRMAYPIKRQKDGVYVYFDFSGGKSTPKALNDVFRVSDFVFRHLTVEKEELRATTATAAATASPAASATPAPKKETPPSGTKEA